MEIHRIVMNPVTRTARRLQAIPLAGLALFFVFPVLTIVARYARVENLADTITNGSLRSVWWFTTWQAVISTVLTLVIALPLTWALSRHTIRFRRIINGLATAPFLMPAVVVATGIRAILPNSHVPAILWAHAAFNSAVVLRVVGARWQQLDPALELSSADLGAHSLRTFVYVVYPHIRSSLRNAAALIFLYCFTSFATVSILGGVSRRTIETEIFTQAIRLGDARTATSLALLQAIFIFLVLIIAQPKHDADVQVLHADRKPSASLLVTTVTYLSVAVIAAPLIAVLLRSFIVNNRISLRGYTWLFNGTTESVGINTASTFVTSATFAISCAALATVAALLISSARNKSRIVSTITSWPLAISAVTLGLGIIVTFNQSPINWRGDRWLIPVIHAVIALPISLRTIQPAVNAIPNDLRDASASLGADPWRTWFTIDLPLLRPALAKASGLSAAISLGEFGATSFLSRSGSTTIPIAIGQLLGHPGTTMPQAAFALASLTIVVVSLLI